MNYSAVGIKSAIRITFREKNHSGALPSNISHTLYLVSLTLKHDQPPETFFDTAPRSLSCRGALDQSLQTRVSSIIFGSG